MLVANDIAPADMLQFKRSVFTGFITDVGGKTSHTAIVARSMDIPAVVGAREASRIIRQDDWDRDRRGCRHRHRRSIADRAGGVPLSGDQTNRATLGARGWRALRHTPAVTLDGERVELLANIEMPGDAPFGAPEAAAIGVALFLQQVPVDHEPRANCGRLDERFEA